jgi:transposase-like protein
VARPKGSTNYSDEERGNVYLTLTTNDGNVKRTARDTGVPESTVRLWKKEWERGGPPDAVVDHAAHEADTFLVKARATRDKALAIMEEKLPEARVSELNAVVGTLDDKITRAESIRNRPEGDEPKSIDARAAGQLLAGFVEQALAASQERQASIREVTENKPDRPALPA